MYWDGTSKSCESCDQSCQSCDGPFDSNCLSCKQDYVLNILPNTQNGRECVRSCPEGKFNNGYSCSLCDPSCKSCFGDYDY